MSSSLEIYLAVLPFYQANVPSTVLVLKGPPWPEQILDGFWYSINLLLSLSWNTLPPRS